MWGNDHISDQDYVRGLFSGTPPNFYEPLTVLSFCAAATTTLKVGTAVAVLPIVIRTGFKQAATIDQMSGGRLILSIGIGAYREEFAAWLRKRHARRGDMLDEGLALMQRLFAELRVAHEHKCYRVSRHRDVPRSRNRNRSTLFSSRHDVENVERTARVGARWVFPVGAHGFQQRSQGAEGTRSDFGRDPSEIEIAPQFSVTVAKTAEKLDVSWPGPRRTPQVAPPIRAATFPSRWSRT